MTKREHRLVLIRELNVVWMDWLLWAMKKARGQGLIRPTWDRKLQPGSKYEQSPTAANGRNSLG
jgi:hypothetical protein